jgi:hypothetical protein
VTLEGTTALYAQERKGKGSPKFGGRILHSPGLIQQVFLCMAWEIRHTSYIRL